MKFSVTAALASLAAAANAKVAFTNSAFDVTPGEPFTLTWAGNTGDVTIVFATGSSTDLTAVETIDKSDSGSSFTWTCPTDITSGVYAFEITDSETTNYSVQFSLFGTTSSSSAAPASSAAATSSAAKSSASSASTAATSAKASSSAPASSAPASSAEASSAEASSAEASSAPASSSAPSSSASTSTGSTSSHSTTKTTSSSTTLSTSSKTSSSTSASKTASKTASATASASATGTSAPANTNSGLKEKSPLAFILVTVAALMYFN